MPEYYTTDISGGNLVEIPLPHKRYFDDRRRRRGVSVNIMRFPLNPHYYVSIKEADNPIWNPREENERGGAWQLCWDDKEGRGLRHDQKFNTAKLAEGFIRKFLRRKFPRNKYFYTDERDMLYHERPSTHRKWYPREGD